MKIQYISDIHCEFHPDEGVGFVERLPIAGDVLVIAGDLCTHRQSVKVLSALAKKFPQIVYVAGNHEYYGSDRGTVGNDRAKLMARHPNLHWLSNSSVEIDGVRFHGTTLWFKNDPMNWQYARGMNDFSQIQGFRKWVYEANKAALKFLENEVKQNDVVVTHHTPTNMSVPERFRNHPLNRFYVCDCSQILFNNKPQLWFHGHTHDSCDYEVLKCRVLCNPHGYMNYETSQNFNPAITVETR